MLAVGLVEVFVGTEEEGVQGRYPNLISSSCKASELLTPNADLVRELDTVLRVGMREIVCRGSKSFWVRPFVELDAQ